MRYAVLAPSSHNSQPWRFVLKGETVELWPDTSRHLAVADPDRRELTLACGASLFCLRLAAWSVGAGLSVKVSASSERPLASITRAALECEFDWEPEFAALPYLRMDFRPFRVDTPTPALLRAVTRPILGGFPRGFKSYCGPVKVGLVRDDTGRQAISRRVEEAAREQWSDALFRKELAGWEGAEELLAYRLGLPPFLAWLAPRLLPVWSPAERIAESQGQQAREAPVLVVLGAAREGVLEWLSCGECLAALALSGRARGLSWSPFLAVTRRASRRAHVGEQSGVDHPQVLLRLGYGGHVPAPPRRGVDEVCSVG